MADVVQRAKSSAARTNATIPRQHPAAGTTAARPSGDASQDTNAVWLLKAALTQGHRDAAETPTVLVTSTESAAMENAVPLARCATGSRNASRSKLQHRRAPRVARRRRQRDQLLHPWSQSRSSTIPSA